MLKSWKVDDHGKYLKKKQNKIKKKKIMKESLTVEFNRGD